VEKKFLLKGDDEKRLIEGADFIGEKVFTDIYYDTKNFLLTINDKWLRQRTGKWELKLPLGPKAATRVGDLYEEIEDEEKIRKALNISGGNEMERGLQDCGYFKFCTCKTTRKKYKKNGFGIDIDFVDYNDDFIYEIAEIELMVQDKSEMPGAMKKIISFAKGNGLTIEHVRGKVVEYLKRKKPEHFQALVNAGMARK